jgi:hypothetical protein
VTNWTDNAQTAREAHEEHFGDAVTYTPPVGSAVPTQATLHGEKTESRQSGSIGTIQVTTRVIFVTKERIATISVSGFFTIGSKTYAIDRVTDGGSNRWRVELILVTAEEVSRPDYRRRTR